MNLFTTMITTLVLSITLFSEILKSQSWQKITGPWDGRISRVTSDAANPATAFAGGTSGVFRSTDNGLSWVQVSAADGSLIAQGNSIASYAITAYERTQSAGSEWKNFTFPYVQSVYSIIDMKIDPNGAGQVFIIANNKLYRSSDFGDNWSIVDDSTGAYPYYGQKILNSKSPANLIYTIGWGSHIRRSTNSGATWTSRRYSSTIDYTSTLAADVDPSNGNIIYIGRKNTVFKSTNSGLNWSTSTLPCNEIRSISVSKSNSSHIYVAHENGVSKSVNAGSTWSTVFANNTFEKITSLTSLANGYLIKSTERQGIHLSTDGGISFRSVGGVQVQPNGMTFYDSDNSLVAWNLSGLYKSSDAGNSWKLSLAYGFSNRNSLTVNPYSSIVWIAAVNNFKNTLYYTENAGDLWFELRYASLNNANEVFYRTAYPDYIYIKNNRSVSRSVLNGINWSLLNDPIPGENLELLTFSPNNQELVLASANSCLAIVRSDNAGISWYSFQQGIFGNISGNYVTDIKFNPQNPNIIYAASNGLYRLDLPSNQWTRIFEPNVDFPYYVNKLLIDPTNSSKMFSVVSYCTIIGSTNGGYAWGNASTGLLDEYKTISNGFISPLGVVYLATGAGIIKGNPVVTDIQDNITSQTILNNYFLEQNFPNPANPTTTINFHIPETDFVSLKLYDILGNEVLNLVEEEKNKGYHAISIDGSSLASGIYIYRLQSGNFTDIKKMTILK